MVCAESATPPSERLKIKNRRSRHKLLWLMKSPEEGPPADANQPLYSFHLVLIRELWHVLHCFGLEASCEGPRAARLSFSNSKG